MPWLVVWAALVVLVVALASRTIVASNFGTGVSSVIGTVVAKEPTNHAIVRVAYDVNGATYVVEDSFIGPPNPGFSDIHIGDSVTVYYDPAAPGRAVLSDPQRRAINEIGFIVLIAVVLPTGFLGVLLLSVWLRR